MSRFACLGGAFIVLLGGCGHDSVATIPHQNTSMRNSTIWVERLDPEPTGEEGVTCRPSETVRFTYRITNHSDQVYRNVAPRLTCRCQITSEPIARLAPGETSEVGFTLRGPTEGRLAWSVPLMAEGIGEPIASLQPVLVVPTTLPQVKYLAESLTWNLVENTPARERFVVETLEPKGKAQWIDSLRLEDDSGFEFDCQVSERIKTDPEIVHRIYEFDIAFAPMKHQRSHKILQLVSNSSEQPIVSSVPVNLLVSPRTDLQPKTLKISDEKGNSGKIFIIRRAGNQKVTVESETSGVSVDAVHGDDGTVEAFDVFIDPEKESGEVVIDIEGERREVIRIVKNRAR